MRSATNWTCCQCDLLPNFHDFTTLLVTILRTKYFPPAAIKTKGPTKRRTLQGVEFIMA